MAEEEARSKSTESDHDDECYTFNYMDREAPTATGVVIYAAATRFQDKGYELKDVLEKFRQLGISQNEVNKALIADGVILAPNHRTAFANGIKEAYPRPPVANGRVFVLAQPTPTPIHSPRGPDPHQACTR